MGVAHPYFRFPARRFRLFKLSPFQDPCLRIYAHVQLLLCPDLVPVIVKNVVGFNPWNSFHVFVMDSRQRMAASHVLSEGGWPELDVIFM